MTAIVSDAVVLDSWNGRPTLWVEVVEGTPSLRWLLLGHAEDFDVWLRVPLSWEQADALCAPDGPQDMEAFLTAGAVGAIGTLTVTVGDDLATNAPFLVPSSELFRAAMEAAGELLRTTPWYILDESVEDALRRAATC